VSPPRRAPSRPGGLLDVERFRPIERRSVVVRRVEQPLLVLGSSQKLAVVEHRVAARRGITVARRRSGGGAVLVGAGDPLWVDVWIPRDDPLWVDDVIRAAGWLGDHWAASLDRIGVDGVEVRAGRSRPAPWSPLVCFAGVGPGEVLVGGRKVVGISQWRSREGALFHSACYRHWDPRPLLDVLALPPAVRRQAAADLGGVATGLDEMAPGGGSMDLLTAAFLRHLPGGTRWDVAIEASAEG
jgi:lipoate-protein ligase A